MPAGDRIREVIELAADTSDWDKAISSAGQKATAFAELAQSRTIAAGKAVAAATDQFAKDAQKTAQDAADRIRAAPAALADAAARQYADARKAAADFAKETEQRIQAAPAQAAALAKRGLLAAGSGALDLAVDGANAADAKVRELASGAARRIGSAATAVRNAPGDAAEAIGRGIRDAAQSAATSLQTAAKNVAESAKAAATDLRDNLARRAEAAKRRVTNAAKAVAAAPGNAVRAAGRGVAGAARAARRGARNAASGVAGAATRGVASARAGLFSAADLALNTDDWDAALDKTNEKVQALAGSAETRLMAASEKISGFGATISKQATGIKGAWDSAFMAGGGAQELLGGGRKVLDGDFDASKFAGSLGESIGGKGGAALGTLFGPVGTAIGAALGPIIGEAVGSNLIGPLLGAIDFAGIDSAFKEAGGSFTGLLDEATTLFSGLYDTGTTALKSLTGAFQDAKFGEIMAMNGAQGVAALETKFAGLSDTAARATEDALGQAVVRLEDFINSMVDRFKEPVAKVADMIQSVGKMIGLVGDDTDKWGDSLRGLKDVGERVSEALAKAFGYVQDVFKIAAGAFKESFVQGVLLGIQAVVDGFAEMVENLKPIFARLGIGGDWEDELAAKARGVAASFQKQADEAGESGAKMVEEGLKFDQAQKNIDKLNENRAAWQGMNDYQDLVREYMRESFAGVVDALKGPGYRAPWVGNPIKPDEPEVKASERVRLALQDSQEARNAILADALNRSGGGGNSPAERALKLAADTLAENKEQTAEQKKTNAMLAEAARKERAEAQEASDAEFFRRYDLEAM